MPADTNHWGQTECILEKIDHAEAMDDASRWRVGSDYYGIIESFCSTDFNYAALSAANGRGDQ